MDINKALKQAEREVLVLQMEKAVKTEDLKGPYKKLRENYSHKETINILADFAEGSGVSNRIY
ncbi:hypothetical protein BU116_01170 [Staphylococcus xylosus]|uniref:hypothetical protein n=1 Tax=Staphylococcus TaxID=1279 RepID=UPI000E67FF90|nr:hypothetical protein [Staphylococcus xylosus]RIM80091.1 hypothetical protein BU116_01170 [Staphylococcus xylosus]